MKNITLNEKKIEWVSNLAARKELQYSINKVKTNLYDKYMDTELYLVRMWGDVRLKAVEDFETDTGYEQSPHHFYTLSLKEAVEWVEAIFKALGYRKEFRKNRITIKNVCYANNKYKIITHKQKKIVINGIECYSIKRILEELLKNKLIGTGFRVERGEKKVLISYKKGKIQIKIKTPYSEEEFILSEKLSLNELDEEKLEFLAWAVEHIVAELYNSTVNSIECGETRLEF